MDVLEDRRILEKEKIQDIRELIGVGIRK